MAKTEVRTVLALDDLASATLAKLQGGFNKLDSTLSGATRHMFDFAKQTAAVAVGVNLGNIFGGVKDLATSAFRESVRADDQMRSLSRTMAGLSAVRGKDMLAFRRDAQGVYEKLTAISRESHVSRDGLVEAFAQAGSNTKRTGTQLEELIGKAAGAARTLGVPVQEVVQGFMEVEKNMISANNPIIAMVKQANLMRGHSEQIALRFQHLSKVAKENLAQKALAAMAAKAKEIPLTFAEMSHQLSDMHTDTLKLVGAPMAAALQPIFENFTHFISDNRGAIEQYARTMGVTAKEWILEAADSAKQGFHYLQTHAEEIKNGIKEGFGYAKSVFQWMLDHKGLIAGAFVAGKVAPTAMAAGGGIVQFGKGLVDVARNGLPALGIASNAAAAGLTGVATTLGLFALAVGGIVLAVDQYRRTVEVANNTELNSKARIEGLAKDAADYNAWDRKRTDAFNTMGDKMVLDAMHLGTDAGAARMKVTAAFSQHEQLVKATGGMRGAAASASGIGDIGEEATGKMSEEQFGAQQQLIDASAKQFSSSMDTAAAGENQAAIAAGAKILLGSRGLQDALRSTAALSAEEFTKLADTLEKSGGDVAEVVKGLRERAGKSSESTNEKGVVPLNVFNGGQTFQIKQDFRDQDPDRIAAIFSRDLSLAAENRSMARTSLAFGG